MVTLITLEIEQPWFQYCYVLSDFSFLVCWFDLLLPFFFFFSFWFVCALMFLIPAALHNLNYDWNKKILHLQLICIGTFTSWSSECSRFKITKTWDILPSVFDDCYFQIQFRVYKILLHCDTKDTEVNLLRI